MSRKIIIGIGIAVLAGLGIWAFFQFWSAKPKEIFWRTAPVERGDVTIIITATGTMNADTSVDVGTQVTGKIAKVLVDFNSLVKRGQILAILDTTLLYANKLEASAAMQKAVLAANQARRDYNRDLKLFKVKVTALADFEQTKINYQTANVNLTSARAELSRARINLQYATIKAPISGQVISRNIQVGNMVIASFNSPTLFTIANDLTKMQVQANVDEADIGQVKLGQGAKFTVDAFPKDVFNGTVTQVRRQPVILQSVVNYVVIVEIANPDLKLMPGLTANLNIFVDEHTNVLRIPTGAFRFEPDSAYIKTVILLPDSVRKKWLLKFRKEAELKKQEIEETDAGTGTVWVRNNKDVYPLKVKRGLSDGTFTEIEGKIKVGDDVVVGINQVQTDKDKKSSSPFMPKFPTKKKSNGR
jgi:HlyD family secretion protein